MTTSAFAAPHGDRPTSRFNRPARLETLVPKLPGAKRASRCRDRRCALSLTSRGSRSLSADLRVQARKLFVRATILIAGRLEIDDRLVARISGLSCAGEGAIGALVCGILNPHLQKAQTHHFLFWPCAWQVQLRDIRLTLTGDASKLPPSLAPLLSHKSMIGQNFVSNSQPQLLSPAANQNPASHDHQNWF